MSKKEVRDIDDESSTEKSPEWVKGIENYLIDADRSGYIEEEFNKRPSEMEDEEMLDTAYQLANKLVDEREYTRDEIKTLGAANVLPRGDFDQAFPEFVERAEDYLERS